MTLADCVDPGCSTTRNANGASRGLLPPADAADLLAAYARELNDGGMPAVAADQFTAAARRARDSEAAAASHLAAYAGQEHGAAAQLAAAPDVTATVVDEHRAGLDQSNTTDGAADLDHLRAAQAEVLTVAALPSQGLRRPEPAGTPPPTPLPYRAVDLAILR